MCDEGNALIGSIQDKDPDDMSFSVKKDGGELDALTAATISSRAYYEAVKRANEAFSVVSGAKSEPDSVSGATETNDNQEGAEAQEGGNNE
jgi:electron transport complex protein RnfG